MFFCFFLIYYRFSAMGTSIDANVCADFAGFGIIEHTKNFWKDTSFAICYIQLWYINNNTVHGRNDCKNAHSWYLEGNFSSLNWFFWKYLTKQNYLYFSRTTEIAARRRAIFSRPLVSIWCRYDDIPMDIYYFTFIRNARNCTEIFLFISVTGATSVDYDSIFACIFKVFDAKKSYQSNI